MNGRKHHILEACVQKLATFIEKIPTQLFFVIPKYIPPIISNKWSKQQNYHRLNDLKV